MFTRGGAVGQRDLRNIWWESGTFIIIFFLVQLGYYHEENTCDNWKGEGLKLDPNVLKLVGIWCNACHP